MLFFSCQKKDELLFLFRTEEVFSDLAPQDASRSKGGKCKFCFFLLSIPTTLQHKVTLLEVQQLIEKCLKNGFMVQFYTMIVMPRNLVVDKVFSCF